MRFGVSAVAIVAVLGLGAVEAGAESAPSWTGVYVGGHVGYGWSDQDWSYPTVQPYSAFCGGCAITQPGEAFDADRAFAGVQAGADYQLGRLVAGVSVSYSASKFSESHGVGSQSFVAAFGGSVESSLGNLLIVSGRLGYAFDGGALAYVTGGYVHGDMRVTGQDTVAFYPFDAEKGLDGWTIGGGAEFRLSKAISLAVQYDHIEFERTTITAPIALLPTFPAVISTQPSVDTVTLRLNLRPF